MFIFITSLRHPNNCNSYERIGYLLKKTLQSVCNQTNDNFKVLVVCNELPNIEVSPQVEFLVVEFPAPSKLTKPETGMGAIRIDRGSKYMAGLVFAHRYNPSFVMFFDADDYVSSQIVNHVSSHPVRSGWFVKTGYQYKYGDSCLSRLDEFHQHCGTSLIYPYDLLEVPAELTGNSSFLSIQKHTDEKYLTLILGSHRLSVMVHRSQGHIFQPLPFTGAIWTLGNGENHSGIKGRPGTIPITDEIRDEFSFYPT